VPLPFIGGRNVINTSSIDVQLGIPEGPPTDTLMVTVSGCTRCGLADHYEQALANAPPPQPIDHVAELLRSLRLE
jgi:hypothetical protein